MCLNVASHIARTDPEKSVVVVDLVLPIGNVAQITGVKTQTDIVSLTELEPMELSVELLRRELPLAPAWGFTVVPGCKDPAQAMRLQAQRLGPADPDAARRRTTWSSSTSAGTCRGWR